MRYSAGAHKRPSKPSQVQVRCELGDAQIIGAEGDHHVGWNRRLVQLVVVPEGTREAQGFLSHLTYRGMVSDMCTKLPLG